MIDMVIYTGGKMLFVQSDTSQGGAIRARNAYELVEIRKMIDGMGVLTSYALVKLPGVTPETVLIIRPDIAYEPTPDTARRWKDIIRALEAGIQTATGRVQ